MTVAELIEELKKYPMDATVDIDVWYPHIDNPTEFEFFQDENRLLITGKS